MTPQANGIRNTPLEKIIMHKLWPCLLIALLAGCVVTTTTTPPVPLPETFSNPGETARQDQWWRQFNDSRLNEYIAAALGANFTIRSAKEKIIEAEALARQSGATLFPAVEGRGGILSKRKNSASGTETFSSGLAASYELDLWGRLRSHRQAAHLDLLASREQLQIAALSVAAETALTWFSCIENDLQLQIIGRQQQINRKNEEIIEIKVRTGQTQMADLLQQRQLIRANDTSLAERTARGEILDHRLQILLGRAPHRDDKKAIATLPPLPPLPETGVPLALLQQRPDVRAAWLAFAAADQRTAAAVANRLPRLSLRAELETTAASSRSLFSNWLTTLAANLVGPIIDGGSRRAEVVRNQAIARQKYTHWGETTLNALKEVEDALTEEEALNKQLENSNQQLELASNSVELLNLRYRQGGENYQRVLLAILSRQELEQAVVNIQLQLLTNRIALYRALSGGLPEPLFQSQPPDGK